MFHSEVNMNKEARDTYIILGALVTMIFVFIIYASKEVGVMRERK